MFISGFSWWEEWETSSCHSSMNEERLHQYQRYYIDIAGFGRPLNDFLWVGNMISEEDKLFHVLQHWWFSFAFSAIYIMPDCFQKVDSKQISVTKVIN